MKLGLIFLCLMFSHKSVAQLIDLDFFKDGRGMHLSPGVLDKLDRIRSRIEGSKADETLLQFLKRRWGIQSLDGKLVGIKSVRYRDLEVGVLGCVACHSGRAAGQFIVGIGNKNIDPGQIGMDGISIETQYKKFTDRLDRLKIAKKSEVEFELETQSLRLMHKLADPRTSAVTQGLVPVSLVGSWFYEVAGLPIPNHGYLGAVKVPSWFGFGKKLEVGQFADAIGKGHPPGWIIGVEITSGQTPESVRAYFDQVEHASDLISQLNPPRYPFSIDAVRAARGKTLFENTCSRCHGTYESLGDGTPIYKTPRVIEQSAIGTDPDRLDYVTPEFLQVVRQSPLSDLIQLSVHAGQRKYVAPRLHAIWARFPYLHNASVPTLRALLEPATKRPKVFSLLDAGERSRFDSKNVGLTSVKINRKKHRWIYDTSIKGQSNQGHEKGIDLAPNSKDDLIEYLKTL